MRIFLPFRVSLDPECTGKKSQVDPAMALTPLRLTLIPLYGEQAPAVSLQPATYLIRNRHLDFVFSVFVIISIDALYFWQTMLVSHFNSNVKFLFLV